MGQKTTRDTVDAEPEKKKLDLSVAQIAGTSTATVAAALLASQMGVYGTILGAGVVSVVATAGGPLVQHLFRRTGDQLRETARPKARQVPVVHKDQAADGSLLPGAALPSEEFGDATVHGTRVRGWKRTAVASGAAFVIALGGLGTYEAIAGTSVSNGGATILSGGTRKAADHKPSTPREDPGRGTDGEGGGKGERDGKGGESPGTGKSSPDPSASPGGESPGPDPTPSRSGESTPAPTPPKPDPGTTPAPTPTPTPGKSTGGSGSGSGSGSGGTGTGTGPAPNPS
ncbi:hypothetical protein OS965_24130 [Streptomyces sp. H27-G5]|uniref:hypothetical protein n=1 Tax=Streptomyces sp. H27-G5 TaxID=2996698 RepID=UPI0022718012|nr:hypothetical protein [Streptomyces sp. H27-G5]MCY0921240.1 hypothetical protein [Streptomyces sp. H27-G5]